MLERREESRRGTQECVRHVGRQRRVELFLRSRALTSLLDARSFAQRPSVEKSLDAARKSACATLDGSDGVELFLRSRALTSLLDARSFAQCPSVEKSLDAARKSACATLDGSDGVELFLRSRALTSTSTRWSFLHFLRERPLGLSSAGGLCRRFSRAFRYVPACKELAAPALTSRQREDRPEAYPTGRSRRAGRRCVRATLPKSGLVHRAAEEGAWWPHTARFVPEDSSDSTDRNSRPM